MRDSDQLIDLSPLDHWGPPDRGNGFVEIFKIDDEGVPERTHVNRHKGDGET